MSPPLPSQSFPSAARSTVPDPPSSVTDAPTPSLCSDNEIDRDATSPEDQPPSTPPINVSIGPSRAFFRFKGNGIPVEPEKLHRSTSTSLSKKPSSHFDRETPLAGPESNQLENAEKNIFNKRLPTSPLPKQPARKTRPPSRSVQRPIPLQLTPHPRNAFNSDEEDRLLLSSSPPEDKAKALSKRHRSSSSSTKTMKVPSHNSRQSSKNNQIYEHLTLDEEIRNATSSSSPGPADDVYAERDGTEAPFYIGTGTRSKNRGFLKGGGAGGTPVFMGVGYVEGVDDNEYDHDAIYESEANSRPHLEDDHLSTSRRRSRR